MKYIGRDGQLGLETDNGESWGGKGFQRELIEDWDLLIDSRRRQTERSIRGGRAPKLVHNLIFSMPPGTDPKKVLDAVRMLAMNQWQLKHRYAMALHTDDSHPHVHVVLKAMSEDGKRLNIRKATLRSWRSEFAANLRDLGVAANATERAVRGESRTRKSDGIFRADIRGESTHMNARRAETMSHPAEPTNGGQGAEGLRGTRRQVVGGWLGTANRLMAAGDSDLAHRVRVFVARMAPARTDSERFAEQFRRSAVERRGDPSERSLE
jgi:hypothetical protein